MSTRQDLDEVIRDARSNIAKGRETIASITDFQERAKDVSPEEGRAILAEIGIVLMLVAPIVGLFNKIVGVSFKLASKGIEYLVNREVKK